MVNTVENIGIRVIKRKESETTIEMKPKKIKSDDAIINNDKNKKTSENMKNRCHKCSRKLSLVGCYACRCGNNYCNRHRFYDQHHCTFDYKTLALEKLRNENPKLQNRRIGDQ